MRAFIKSVDEWAWRAIVTGWKHPMMINEQKEEVLKPKDQWNIEEEKLANYNSKALNAIFSAVDINQFKLIATCESAKEAWTTLQIAYEGTATVQIMEESETIATFNAKLCDIANEAQALSIQTVNLFAYKVTAIEEARDIEKIKLDELMGSLQIFELNLNHNRRDKEKSVAFQAEVPKSTSASEDNDDMLESLAFVTNVFGKFLKMMDENSNKPKSGKSFNSQNDKTNFNSFDDRKNKRIQCRECEGDEEFEGSQENDHTTFNSKMMNNHREHVATNQRYVPTIQYNATCLTSFTATCEKDISESETNSDDDEPNIEEIEQMYNKIFQKWLEICKINKSHEKQIIVLNKEKESMKVEILEFMNLVAEKDRKIHETEQELLHTQKMMKLDSGKKKLDEILSNDKPCSDNHGLGYIGESLTSKTIFVKKTKPVQSIFDKSKKLVFQKPKAKRFIPICNFYNLSGHIQPRCFRFKKALRNGMNFGSPASAMLQQKSKLKSDLRCFIADISLKACNNDTWYFNSGCSKHMIGDKEKLKGYQSVNEGHIIFRDGEKGCVLEKGVLNVEGLPKFKNVLHLCDQNLFVRFNKNKCQVFDETDICVLTGSRSSDNRYMLQQHQEEKRTEQNDIQVTTEEDVATIGKDVATNKTRLGTENDVSTEIVQKEPSIRVQKNHHTNQIIGSFTEGMQTRDKPKVSYKDMVRYVCFTSLIEPKNEKEKKS
ncbi:hypothetical protein Pfo_010913 [Paulownia fortunei]|nr:hypothetical protein Pfo_010913 [Paulownia fortunei]